MVCALLKSVQIIFGIHYITEPKNVQNNRILQVLAQWPIDTRGLN